MAITWKELGRKIQAMTADQLLSDVTIHLHSQDEYYSVDHYELTDDNEEDRLDDGHPFLVVLDKDRSDHVRSYLLVDNESTDNGRLQLVNLSHSESGGLLEIGLPGYGVKVMDDDFNGVICLENHGGLRLLVWADINKEDPTHVINLSDAKLEKRLPDLEVDDVVWVKSIGLHDFEPMHFHSWDGDTNIMRVWPNGRSSHTMLREHNYRKVDDWSLVDPAINGGKPKKW